MSLPFDPSWITTLSAFLWAYALVSAIGWVRAVRRERLNTHIGYFASLCGVLVPLIGGAIMLIMLGGFAGLVMPALLGIALFPGCLFLALQLELNRLRPSTIREELLRLGAVVCLAALVI